MKDTNLLIGIPNTGKTTTILFNEVKKAIANGENLCLLDNRDEYLLTFYNTLKENNYNVLVLNLVDPSRSNGFNPLDLPYTLYKEGKKDEAATVINDLALEIFKDTSSSDPFWENMSASYFTGLSLVLFKEAKESEINLGSIQLMANQGEEKYEDSTYLKKYLEKYDAMDPVYAFLSPIVYAPVDTRMSILSVFKQKINLYLARERLFNLLRTSDIKINNLQDKTAIIITADKHTNIANVLISQLIESSGLNFTYVFDNFDSLNPLVNFESYLKEASYNKNKFYVVTHSVEELKSLYGEYILDKFQSQIDMKDMESVEGLTAIPVGSDNDYPELKVPERIYFNFKELFEK